MSAKRAVLLTGATGFVGMEVLARWLERGDRRVVALVRADSDTAAGERLRAVLEVLDLDPGRHDDRLEPLAGDLEQPCLGLPLERLEELARTVGVIVHCAASVSFTLSLERSRQINVLGTRRILELAAICRELGELERLTYVSTAYVAGTHEGRFGEDDFDVGQGFRNPYERSKFEAEAVVRERGRGLPVQIVRPSIVVGERDSGWTPVFNVLYTPLRAFARGAFRVVPANYRAPVDVVPVDYVADAIFELSRAGPEGTYNLVAGRDATSLGRLAELASGRFGRRPPPSVPRGLYRRLVHPLALRLTRGRKRKALERSEAFLPYFQMKVRYDDRRARRRLESRGIRVTPVEEYFDRLVDFAERARWGRRPLPRRGNPGLVGSRTP